MIRVCFLVSACALWLLPGVGRAASGGPDAFGYTFLDEREPGGPSFSYQELSGPLTIAIDGSVPVSLPFSFPFYGELHDELRVAEDGLLVFGGSGLGPINGCLPAGSPVIAPWWDAWLLPPWSAEIHVGTAGSAPSRVFLIEWYDVRDAGVQMEAKFEVKLFEGGAIEFHFDEMEGAGPALAGASGTVGIGHPTAGSLEYSCNSASLSPGRAIRFEPPPEGDDDDSGDDDDDDDDDAGDDDTATGDDDDSAGGLLSGGGGCDPACQGTAVRFSLLPLLPLLGLRRRRSPGGKNRQ